MWSVYTVIGYFLLALLIPLGWALGRTWRRARTSRHLDCPAAGFPALVRLDPWYAVRMHARGDSEPRVRDCTCWPAHGECRQECLEQIGTTV
ncbi:MAG: hypothetical protein LAQ69_38060 [Acidobacteriia bacterium]|nr:hypothetical protein [Terriglobia bacterium]